MFELVPIAAGAGAVTAAAAVLVGLKGALHRAAKRRGYGAPWLLELCRRLEKDGWEVTISSDHLDARLGDREIELRLHVGILGDLDRLELSLSVPPGQHPMELSFELTANRLLDSMVRDDPKIGHPRLDALLSFSCGDLVRFRRVMRRRAVHDLLGACMDSGTGLSLSKGRLSWEFSGVCEPVEMIRRIGLLEVLQDELSRQGKDLEEWSEEHLEPSRGFAVFQARARRGESVQFQDTIRGYQVQLQDVVESSVSSASPLGRDKGPSQGPGLRIRVALQEGMPSGLRVMPSQDELVGMVEIYNPILRDAVAVFGRPAERVRSLLSHDAVLPGLMALFMERKDALVHESRVEVTIALHNLDVVDLEVQIRDLVDLASSLDGVMREA